jgi:tetratricopeptide (TPR) repeat protein
LGKYETSKLYLDEALEVYLDMGHPWGQSNVHLKFGMYFDRLGCYSEAHNHHQQALALARQIGDERGQSWVLNYWGLLHYHQADYERAYHYCQQAFNLAQKRNDRRTQGYALTNIGHILTAQRKFVEAEAHYQDALTIRRQVHESHLLIETLAGIAALHLRQGQPEHADIAEILTYLEIQSLAGTNEPFFIYWTCYQVLAVNHDPRGPQILHEAYQQLQEHAASIGDSELRDSFLKKNVDCRNILTAWEEFKI